jgi:hypothetical protein
MKRFTACCRAIQFSSETPLTNTSSLFLYIGYSFLLSALYIIFAEVRKIGLSNWTKGAKQYVQEKADVSSGRQTHQGKSQSSVARIACAEETKRMESIDKAIYRMVSESSGRNESERTGDLENLKPRGRTHCLGVKATRIDAD